MVARSAEGRHVTGRRADLQRLRNPSQLLHLRVEGPGIASIAGIERCTRLQTLDLVRLPAPELERIVGLTELRQLYIEMPDGDVDLRPLERLAHLEYLTLDVPAALGRRVAELDLSRLRDVDQLRLMTQPALREPIDLGWICGLHKLGMLVLDGFVIADADIERLRALPALRRVSFTPRSPAQAQLADSCLPVSFGIEFPPQGHIFEHPQSHGSAEYSVGIDLAGQWDIETNLDAEERLRRLLARRDPELAARLAYDTESSAVWLLAANHADLEAVLENHRPRGLMRSHGGVRRSSSADTSSSRRRPRQSASTNGGADRRFLPGTR